MLNRDEYFINAPHVVYNSSNNDVPLPPVDWKLRESCLSRFLVPSSTSDGAHRD